MLSVADEEGGVCLYDTRKHGPSARLKGKFRHLVHIGHPKLNQTLFIFMLTFLRLGCPQQCNI